MVYPKQIETANIILEKLNNENRYVQLNAQMQSGKTGTYLWVVVNALRSGIVKKAIIISGSRSLNLRKMLNDDVTQISKDTFISPELINVYFGQDLNKIDSLNDSIIVWDESHYAQSIGNSPDKLFTKHGISVNGNVDALTKKNIYFISVSATPFSEESDIFHLQQEKSIVYFNPGNEYRGVSYFLENNNIVKYSGMDSTINTVMNLFKKRNKYNIIRSTGKTNENLKKKFEKNGYCVKLYDQQHSDIENFEVLENQPNVPTVIIIKNFARMGERISPEHIGFVFETSIKPKADTILQGLLGRMAGFGHNHNVKIYVSDNCYDDIVLYDRKWKGENVLPTTGTNICSNSSNKTPTVDETKNGRVHQIVPIICKTDVSSIENIVRLIQTNQNVINLNNTEQTNEVIQYLQAADSKFKYRNVFKNGVVQKSYSQFPERISLALNIGCPTKLSSSCGVSPNSTELNIWNYNSPDNFVEYPYIPQKCFIIDTRTICFNHLQNKPLDIPITTGKEVFCKLNEEVLSGNIGIDFPKAFDTSSQLYEFLNEKIPAFSNLGGKYINFDLLTVPITEFKIFEKTYLARLRENLNTDVKIKRCRGTKETIKNNQVRIKQILWT